MQCFLCLYAKAQQHFCILLLVDGSPTAGYAAFVVPASCVREQRARRALTELNVVNTDCAPCCDFRCIYEEHGAQLIREQEPGFDYNERVSTGKASAYSLSEQNTHTPHESG